MNSSQGRVEIVGGTVSFWPLSCSTVSFAASAKGLPVAMKSSTVLKPARPGQDRVALPIAVDQERTDVLDLVEHWGQHADEDRADIQLLVLQQRHGLVLEDDPAIGGIERNADVA